MPSNGTDTQLLIAFLEARARLLHTTSDQFAGGDAERASALVQTEHDYNALAEVGAEAASLQADLEQADREATAREAATAALLVTQMTELTEPVRTRIPPAAEFAAVCRAGGRKRPASASAPARA